MEIESLTKTFTGKIFISTINLVLSSIFMDLLISFNKNLIVPYFFPELKKLVIKKNNKSKIYLGKFLKSIIRAVVVSFIIYIILNILTKNIEKNNK